MEYLAINSPSGTIDFFFHDIGFVFQNFIENADFYITWANKLIANDEEWLEPDEFMFKANRYIRLQLKLRF